MSSRRRRSRDKTQQVDAFNPDEVKKTDTGSLEDFTNLLYSSGEIGEELRRADAKPTKVKKLALDKVRPDPLQARRVMPTALRIKWIQKPAAVVEVLNAWLADADDEAAKRGRPHLDVQRMLERDPENTDSLPDDGDLPDMGPIENSFRAMVRLAASIRHHGLANPITVVSQPDGTFQLETGERRLLAYNLLDSLPTVVTEDQFDLIPARVVDEKSLWRQAAENGARQDLNAISVARQLALLLMDVYQGQHAFIRPDIMPGRDWYAQVYDSKAFPVPYGRGSELAAAIGLKSSNQIRQYRQLLDLPQRVWEYADDLDWTEYKVRQLRTQAKKVAGANITESEEDALLVLADYEAGELHELPEDYAEVVGASIARQKSKKAKSSSAGSRGGGKTVIRQAPAEVVHADADSGEITLTIDDPEVLALLASGERVVISIKRE